MATYVPTSDAPRTRTPEPPTDPYAQPEAPRTLRDVVARELRRMILDGRLSPGERLTEERVADLLDVSRNPVREAIRSLEAEGFLDVSAHRGAVVAELTAKQASDLFEVRLALEPLGARIAATQRAPQLIRRMRAILLEVETNSQRAELDELPDLHSALHGLIFEMSGNAYLTAIALPMVRRGQWLLRQAAAVRDPAAWSEHYGLIDAIEQGDPDLAETLARHHVLSVRTSMLGVRYDERRAN